MQRGFKTRAENIAVEYRQVLGLHPEDPLSAAHLASHLGIPLIRPDQIPGMPTSVLDQLLRIDPDSWSAALVPLNGLHVILYNPCHSPYRHESDVMHEMGHVICKHNPSSIAYIPGFPLPLRGYDKETEEEAAWLGACLQLPRVALLWAIRSGMEEQEMAEHFGASLQQIRFRRSKTAVDRQLRLAR